MIQPWDASTVGPIEKGIQKANLGLNPAVDGKIIRISMPELSEERRIEFTKIVKKMTEDGRVAIRHVRREAMDAIKKDVKSGVITEDEGSSAEKEVQNLTDKYIAHPGRSPGKKGEGNPDSVKRFTSSDDVPGFSFGSCLSSYLRG